MFFFISADVVGTELVYPHQMHQRFVFFGQCVATLSVYDMMSISNYDMVISDIHVQTSVLLLKNRKIMTRQIFDWYEKEQCITAMHRCNLLLTVCVLTIQCDGRHRDNNTLIR